MTITGIDHLGKNVLAQPWTGCGWDAGLIVDLFTYTVYLVSTLKLMNSPTF